MANYYLTPITTILQYFTDAGVVLNGGKVYTYAAGTSTPQQTKTDSTGAVNNANPIILNAAGRLNNVNIWQLQGVKLKIIIQDASGNQIGPAMDQIAGINDPTDLLASLSAPASGSGVDLVANAMRSYDLISSVRAANTPSLSAGQTLVIDIQASTTPGDNLGGLFYWDASSALMDDGISVIKPTAVSGNGRYIRQTQVTLTSVTQNSNYTFTLADAYRQVLHNDSSSYTYGIPTNASVAFPIGTVLTVVNFSSSTLSITGGSPAFVYGWGSASALGITVNPFMYTRILKIGTDSWSQLQDTGIIYSGSSFTGTITGCTAAITGNVFYSLVTTGIRSFVSLFISAAITGVSNTTSCTMTGLPAALTPSSQRIVPCMLQDNGASVGGWASVSGTTVTFGTGINNNAAGFTAASTKGVPLGWTISYPLS